MHSRQIDAAEFKQTCLALMDEVTLNQTELVITKHSLPLCRLVPLPHKACNRFGWVKDAVVISGDITEPVDEHWEANDD